MTRLSAPTLRTAVASFSTLVWVLSSTSLLAQFTSIPDPQFEQYLIDAGVDSDATVNGQALTSDLEAATFIDFVGWDYPGISDLTGMEAMTGLTWIWIEDANISSIDVTNAPGLQDIILYEVGITTVDVSQNPLLRDFDATQTPIQSMDFSNNDLLEEINLFYTSVNSLVLGSKPVLNRISMLVDGGNGPSNFDISGCPALEVLSLYRMPVITELDLSNAPLLHSIYMERLSLTELDLSANPNLSLFQYDTPSAHNSPLTSLNLRNGNNGALTSFSLTGHPNLFCAEVDNGAQARSNSGVYWNWAHDPHMTFGDNCNLTAVPDTQFEQYLIDEGIDDVANGYVLTDLMATPTFIDFVGWDYPGISDLTGMEAMTGLTWIWIEDANISSIDVTNAPGLQDIILYEVGITTVDVSQNPLLRDFDATQTPIQSMDFSNNDLLEEINLFYTSVNSLVLGNKPALNRISMLVDGGNGPSNFDISGCPALEVLSLYRMPVITELDLSGAPLLHSIYMEQLSLTELDLSANPNLTLFQYNTALVHNSPLQSFSVANGNNGALTSFSLTGHPLLSCVLVDNPLNAEANQGVYWNWAHDAVNFGHTTCDKTYVPDDQLEQYLINQGFDNVLDDYVLTDEMAKVTTLQLFSGLNNTTGMEALVGLKHLQLGSGSSVAGTLFANWPLLETVDISGRKISGTADFSLNPNLSTFSLSSGAMGAHFANPLLTSINYSSSQSTDGPITFGANPALTHIDWYAGYDNQNTIDLTGCTALQHLDIFNPLQLEHLFLDGLTDLSYLQLYDAGAFGSGLELDLSTNTGLQTVSLNSFSFGSPLTGVNLKNGNNALLTNCTIQTTQTIQCVLVDDAFAANAGTGSYASWNSPNSVTFSETCDLVYVPDDQLEQYLIDQGYDHRLNDYIDRPAIELVSHVNLFAAPNDETGMEAMTGLQHLQLDNSTDLPGAIFANWPLLETVNLSGMRITGSADFSLNPLLSTFELSSGGMGGHFANPLLTTFNYSSSESPNMPVTFGLNPLLTSIDWYAGYDPQSTLDLTGCAALEHVDIFNAWGLEQLNVDGLTQLRHLELTDAGANGSGLDLDLSTCTALETLRIYSFSFGCPLTGLNLQNGNNAILTNCTVESSLAPVSCVLVDDGAAANADTGVYASWNHPAITDFYQFTGGCLDPTACNYQPLACSEDGSCHNLAGCTDPTACNFDPTTNCDDGSCEYLSCAPACPKDLNGDGQVGTSDLLMVLAVFGSNCSTTCPEDLNGDSNVGTSDLLELLADFGTACP